MAKKERREARKKLSKKVDITQPILPIDITKFGTEEDPCFGKLHDLTEDACKRCGDSTICSIVMNQDTKKLRATEETEGRFKDLEIDGPVKPVPQFTKKEINKYIKSSLAKGTIRLVLVKNLNKKFGIEKQEAKELINKQK
jgi:hypothetical protein